MKRPVLVLALLATAACASSSDDGESATQDLSSLKTYWADAKKLDLSDLTRVAAGFATGALNDQLTANVGPLSAGLQFETPSVFAPRAEPSHILPTGAQIKALDTIVSGLAAQFGETELGTQVNKARLAHLENGADDYFVESAFTVKAGLDFPWSFPASGLGEGATTTLGFSANGALTSRIIMASRSDGLEAMVKAPLVALKGMRGFVYPRSIDDIRALKPGEMFALRGQGNLGANFGVGAPVFVADPLGPLGYSIVASAGVAGVVSGQIDVQLVRLPGDEVVIDLGVTKGKGVSFHAGLRDAWGIKGLCDDGIACLRPVQLAGKTIGLDRLVEKAIEKQLNKYLTFDVSASAGTSSSRVSLSRFRIHLDRGDGLENAKAVEQLLKFDLRLAQALYNRDLAVAQPAITADFDAVRVATTSTRNFGFEVLGMNVYHRAIVDRDGTFTLQTPDGAKSILFDHLRKDEGWFQRKHVYARTGVAAETIDAQNRDAYESQAHLFMETVSADDHVDNDFVQDNVDALVRGLAGDAVVDLMDRYGNEIERTLWKRCPVDESSNPPSWREDCNVKLLDDASFLKLRSDGLAAVDAKLGGRTPDARDLVRQAAELRFKMQSVGVLSSQQTGGPEMSFATNVHLDDAALDALTSRSKDDYAASLRAFVGMVSSPRRDVRSAKDRDYFRKAVENRSPGAVDRMAAQFEAGAKAYRAILAAEKGLPRILSGKAYVQSPVGIRFTVGRDEASTIESVVLRSTSHERALAAVGLFDGILDAAGGLDAGLDPEHATLYPLLPLVPAASLEVAMNVTAKVESSFFNPRKRFQKVGLSNLGATAKGSDVATIGAGMFDIKTIAAASP